MQSMRTEDPKTIEIDTQHRICSVFFAEDGEQVFSSGDEEVLRQWRVGDGQEGLAIRDIGEVQAAALSRDNKRLVCGLSLRSKDPSSYGRLPTAMVRVWDVQTIRTVLDIKTHYYGVSSVDISSDSTKLATAGGSDKSAFIWSMSTGEKLLGPLQHEDCVDVVRFSPTGDRIATATCKDTGQTYISRYAISVHIYHSGNGERVNIRFPGQHWSRILLALAWSADGRQIIAASGHEVKCFDSFSGSLLSEWPAGNCHAPCIAVSHNQRFIAISSNSSLSFWDTSIHKQIGTVIDHTSQIRTIALSPSDDCVATGEQNGRVVFRNLVDILPRTFLTLNVSDSLHSYKSSLNTSWTIHFPPRFVSECKYHVLTCHKDSFSFVQLPFMYITDPVSESWTKGDLSRTEELLTEELVYSSDSLYHACTLANRALVQIRLGHQNLAIVDAEQSIKIRRSVVGHIANAMARVYNGEHDSALCAFDLVFSDDLEAERNLLLLIKTIVLFQCGKHDDAMSRVNALIDIVDDPSLYVTVRAHMFLLLADLSLKDGDNEGAIELLKQAREAKPFQEDSRLVVISLIFGWDFDKLALEIQLHFQECIKPIEANGDAALQSKNPTEARLQYSTALTLDPLNPAGLFVKRSKAQAIMGSWEDALKDADEAIKADPPNPWGYERKHAALHALHRFNEAVDAFTRMFSLIEDSLDQDIRQLTTKYVSPTQLEATIESVVREVFKICPPVLIDVESGRLCDGPARLNIFKTESQSKELVSSMTEGLDNTRITQVVEKYFEYVMLSHLREGKEPSFQDINMVTSVWNLDMSPLDEKLKKFCEVVRGDGHRWAWSDTCCVDKTISIVLNQSLTMMYKWYEASAATLVFLAGISSPSTPGDLMKSVWMTRTRTVQAALAPKIVRFYDHDWQPYLGDTRANHRESPEIMQELADAIGIPREAIIAFNPDDLSICEKLRLASTRTEAVEEDIAYALIGIFKSDIQPHYGEGDAALGHLLEEIVARSGDVTVLSWTGKSSPYNSCLPDTLAVYSQPPNTFPTIEDAEMDERVAALRNSLPQKAAMLIYDRVTRLPPARFTNRRLHLPCIIFAVKKLNIQDVGVAQETHYRARVSGVGHVEIQTSDSLLTEPFKLILVHLWIRDLRDPFDAFTLENEADASESESESESEPGTDSEFESAPSSPLSASMMMDDYTRALRLVARLRQPFHALLLQQQRNGQFKRVATEHEIVVPGIDRAINFGRDVRTEVVEVL